jgi:hypothetical protein
VGLAIAVSVACVERSSHNRANDDPAVSTSRNALVFYDGTCTANEQNQVAFSEPIALSATKSALRLVGNNGAYTRWFGTWSSTRETLVRSVLNTVISSWPTMQGDCDQGTLCATGSAAWAIPGSGGPVHLCDPYFSNLGRGIRISSKETTGQRREQALVHERAHAASTAIIDQVNSSVCTFDAAHNCYGWHDALALALANADQATKNADNYALFVEHVYGATTIVQSTAIIDLEPDAGP